MEATKQITENDVFGLLDKMKVVRKETEQTLSNHYRNESHNLIPKSKYLGMGIGDKIYFNKTKENYAELVCISSEKLVFIVINEKDTVVQKHKHDFHEYIHILKGKLWEAVSDRVYIQHEDIKIRPFQLHGFKAKEYSIYTAIINLL